MNPLLPVEVLQLISMQVESLIDSVVLSRADITSSCLNQFELLGAYIGRASKIDSILLKVFVASFQSLFLLETLDNRLQRAAQDIWSSLSRLTSHQQSRVLSELEQRLKSYIVAEDCIAS